MKEYKDTLLMPQTAFEMRGNLGKREPEFQQAWEAMDLYNKVQAKNKNKPYYVLHDGPPYANGDIHIGHALNKILKDFVVRYKSMSGYNSPYIPGWDTHGLPIETALTKKGVDRKSMSVPDFRRLCEAYALEQIDKQKAQFKRLGVLGEWNNPYATLNKDYEADQIRVFAKMVDKGLIYKGLKPVYWSTSSESALAEAEIEYHEKRSPSIYFALPLVDATDQFEGNELLVWTTTPWTLPGNLAVAVGEDIEYVSVRINDRKFIIAKALYERVLTVLEAEGQVLSTFKGSEMTHLRYQHPLYPRISAVVLGHHVSTEDGTGMVHIAPGHGEDDFIIGKANGLEVLCPVDDKGVMTEASGPYQGLFYDDANKKICEDLEAKNALLKLSIIKHSYPHDWRTKKPVIFRATPQWFASIEGLKEHLLREVKKVNWVQKWGELRIYNMIKDRQEWCISRQRAWGVPIPVFYAEDGTEILDQNVLNHVANLFEEHGSHVWFEWDANALLPQGYTHPNSPNGVFKKETDIMDVWFDSGSSHQVLLRRGLPYPANLYLEGSDQYRGWFNSSLSTGVATTNMAPYQDVVTHGFVVDADGKKMSKSQGNVIDPLKVMNQMGADILRLWVASIEYSSDVRISDDMMKQVSESYRKIRNTFKFMLGNLFDFNPQTDAIAFEEMNKVDQYMMVRLNEATQAVINAYDGFSFNEVYRHLVPYIINDLSAFYLDFTKDILYIEAKNAKERRSSQTVYYEVLSHLLRLLTPILPHTTSEAYQHMPYKAQEDVYLEDMPKIKEYNVSEHLVQDMELFLQFRDEVLKQLEEARNQKLIGKSLSAALTVAPSKALFDALNRLNVNLKQLLIVSEVTLLPVVEKTHIHVSAAIGHVCSRCWTTVEALNDQELCQRCHTVVTSL